MAIAFRGATNATTSTGTLTINAPAGTAAGDVQLISITYTTGTAPATPSASGWTVVHSGNYAAGSMFNWTLSHVSSGADSSYTFTVQTGLTVTAALVGYSGVDNTTPVNVTSAYTNGLSSSMAIPTLTTTAANCQVVTLPSVICNAVAATLAYPSPWTGRTATAIASGANAYAGDEAKATAGTTTAANITITGTSPIWLISTVALQPPQAGSNVSVYDSFLNFY